MAKLKRKTWTMADVEAGIVDERGNILKPKDDRTDEPPKAASVAAGEVKDKAETAKDEAPKEPAKEQAKEEPKAEAPKDDPEAPAAETVKA